VALASGDLEAALRHAQTAIELAPKEREYRLMMARVLAASGDYPQAIARVREVLDEGGVEDIVAARAHCQWGDYLARSAARDYGEAIQHHQQAIKLAAPLAGHELYAVRRAAKEVLLDAHLGVAYDIGWGRWQQKAAVSAKWIDRAAKLADDLQSHERGGPEVRFKVYAGAVAALSGKWTRLCWRRLDIERKQHGVPTGLRTVGRVRFLSVHGQRLCDVDTCGDSSLPLNKRTDPSNRSRALQPPEACATGSLCREPHMHL
jgi:tetratricopeptide (TPR) repeat protein